MESRVFPTPEVKTALEQFVRVRLYVDGGANAEANATYQEKLVGGNVQPWYVIMTPDEKVVAEIGYQPDAKQFAEFLEKGLKDGAEKKSAQK